MMSVILIPPLVRFLRTELDRRCLLPVWPRAARPVFADVKFPKPRMADRVQVFRAEHGRRHTSAIILDLSKISFLQDVRDRETPSRLQDAECFRKHGRLVGA